MSAAGDWLGFPLDIARSIAAAESERQFTDEVEPWLALVAKYPRDDGLRRIDQMHDRHALTPVVFQLAQDLWRVVNPVARIDPRNAVHRAVAHGCFIAAEWLTTTAVGICASC